MTLSQNESQDNQYNQKKLQKSKQKKNNRFLKKTYAILNVAQVAQHVNLMKKINKKISLLKKV